MAEIPECVCDRAASMKTMNETKQKIFMQIEKKKKTKQKQNQTTCTQVKLVT